MNTWRQASEYLRVRRAERESLRWISAEQQKLLKRCAARIAALEDDLEETQRAVIFWKRELIGALVGWRVSIEKPEIDVRDELDEKITELRDHMAQVEEYVL